MSAVTRFRFVLVLAISLPLSLTACARLHLPAIFSDSMVPALGFILGLEGWRFQPGANESTVPGDQTNLQPRTVI